MEEQNSPQGSSPLARLTAQFDEYTKELDPEVISLDPIISRHLSAVQKWDADNAGMDADATVLNVHAPIFFWITVVVLEARSLGIDVVIEEPPMDMNVFDAKPKVRTFDTSNPSFGISFNNVWNRIRKGSQVLCLLPVPTGMGFELMKVQRRRGAKISAERLTGWVEEADTFSSPVNIEDLRDRIQGAFAV